MPKFKFIAIDSDGKERRGMVEAPSRRLASEQIKSHGMLPAKVTVARAEKQSPATPLDGSAPLASKKPVYFGAAVKKKELSEFTRKLSTLLQAGLTILRCLEVLRDQEKNVVFRWIVSDLAESIRSGGTFSDALAKYPKEFDFLYVNMARAGEASGMLDVSLARLAAYLEKTERMKARLISAMTYPVVVMTLASIIVVALLLFVVPSFEKVFQEQLGDEAMPQLTQVVLFISKYLLRYWWAFAFVLVGLFALHRVVGASTGGRAFYDWLKLRVTGLGDLNVKIYVIRFARTLGTLIESSVPILEALRITRDACGNVHVMQAVERVRSRVKDGDNIAHTLAATKIFPLMVPSMIEVGEETGDLPEMLNQIADVYDEEVDNAISSLTSLVQPLMIVGLAGVVVVIVVALFLPFIKILQSIGSQ